MFARGDRPPLLLLCFWSSRVRCLFFFNLFLNHLSCFTRPLTTRMANPQLGPSGKYPQLSHHAAEIPFVFHVLSDSGASSIR